MIVILNPNWSIYRYYRSVENPNDRFIVISINGESDWSKYRYFELWRKRLIDSSSFWSIEDPNRSNYRYYHQQKNRLIDLSLFWPIIQMNDSSILNSIVKPIDSFVDISINEKSDWSIITINRFIDITVRRETGWSIYLYFDWWIIQMIDLSIFKPIVKPIDSFIDIWIDRLLRSID